MASQRHGRFGTYRVALIKEIEEGVANGAMPNQSRYFAQTTPVMSLSVESSQQTEINNQQLACCSI
jgi:hypothetical protein